MSEHTEHLVADWIERNQPEGMTAPTITRTEAQALHVELRVAACLLMQSVNLRCYNSALIQAQRAAHLSAAILVLEKEGQ